jgi:hypothetical protein
VLDLRFLAEVPAAAAAALPAAEAAAGSIPEDVPGAQREALCESWGNNLSALARTQLHQGEELWTSVPLTKLLKGMCFLPPPISKTSPIWTHTFRHHRVVTRWWSLMGARRVGTGKWRGGSWTVAGFGTLTLL